jgi:cold shock CspA family protein
VSGTVVSFDPHVGLGVIAAPDGRRFPFHCVAIADGTRRIEVGTDVSFTTIARMGRWEAWGIASQ